VKDFRQITLNFCDLQNTQTVENTNAEIYSALIWHRGANWAGCSPSSPHLAVPNVTAHPSTASVPITVLPYDGPLLCGYNASMKWLMSNISLQTRVDITHEIAKNCY